MKKLLLPLAVLFCCVSCKEVDEIEFSGTVVDYEECNGMFSMGYAVSLSSPDTIGGDYLTHENILEHNVVVIYGADQLLSYGDKIEGSFFLDPNYSKSECYIHFDRQIPEAQFTKLKVVSKIEPHNQP